MTPGSPSDGAGPGWRRVPIIVLRALDPRNLFDVGPVFRRDAVIDGRRAQTYRLRFGAAALLLVILGLAMLTSAIELDRAGGGPAARLEAMSRLGGVLVLTIGWTQFVVLSLVAPMLTAGAISEERLNKTLPSLFSTPLTSREIVAGKLTSRLMQAAILGLLPLPVLLLLRAFGGVSLETILVFHLVTAGSVVLGAAIGLAMSAGTARGWSVVFRSVLLMLIVNVGPWLWLVVSVWLRSWAVAERVAPILSPSMALAAWVTDGRLLPGAPFMIDAAATVWACAAWQLGLAAALCWLTAARLRAVVFGPSRPSKGRRSATPAPAAKPGRRSRTVTGSPVFWREFRQPMAASFAAKLGGVLLVAAVVAGLTIVYIEDEQNGIHSDRPPIIVGLAGGLAFLLFAIARTTGLIALERESRTWDALMTTPMTGRAMAYAKFFGATAKMALVPIAIGAFILVSSLGRGTHAIGALLTFMALVSGAALLGGTGLLFGSLCRKNVTASVLNLTLALGLWVGPFIVAGFLNAITDVEPLLDAAVLINPAALLAAGLVGAMRLAEGEAPAFAWPSGRVGTSAHTLLATLSAVMSLGGAVLAIELTGARLRSMGAAARRATPTTGRTSDAAGRRVVVADAVACTRCGYDLGGLPADGACPECGTPIEESVGAGALGRADPAFLGRLRTGVRVVLASVVAGAVTAVFGFVGVVAARAVGGDDRDAATIFVVASAALVGFVVKGVFSIGWWRLTSRQPGPRSPPEAERARRRTRAALLVAWGFLLAAALLRLLFEFVRLHPVGVVGMIGLAGAAWIVFFFTSLLHARWLASRLGAYDLRRRAVMLMWQIPVLCTIGAVVLLGPPIALGLYYLFLRELGREIPRPGPRPAEAA